MLAIVLNEQHTATITAQMGRWAREDVEMHAPFFAHYDVANTLTRNRFDKDLSRKETDEALRAIAKMPVRYDTKPDKARAIEIAVELQRRSISDAFYLELAERLNEEFWTLDGPLSRNPAAARHRLRLID